jgi:hypothetical protein
MQLTPFHLAIPVRDIDESRDFYGYKLGFPEGRSTDEWIDFNMFGHQLVTHLNTSIGRQGKVQSVSNVVDGKGVPIPHFGVVLNINHWNQLTSRVSKVIDNFIIEPHTRFEGKKGEQRTMFFEDPSGNYLEFKAFKDINSELFKK